MNIKYLAFGAFGAVGLAILATFAVPAVQYAGADPHSRIIASISNIRQINLALKTYHEDHASDSSMPYPSSLEGLIADNYLTEVELKKLGSGMKIDYFPPTENKFSKNHILIVSHIPAFRIPGFVSIPGYVIYGKADGSISSEALK